VCRFAQEEVKDEQVVCRICEEVVTLAHMVVHSEECTYIRECAIKAFESDKQLNEVRLCLSSNLLLFVAASSPSFSNSHHFVVRRPQLSQKLLKRILKERAVPPDADPLLYLSEEDLRFNERFKVLIELAIHCWESVDDLLGLRAKIEQSEYVLSTVSNHNSTLTPSSLL
jgi:hypothetical protein